MQHSFVQGYTVVGLPQDNLRDHYQPTPVHSYVASYAMPPQGMAPWTPMIYAVPQSAFSQPQLVAQPMQYVLSAPQPPASPVPKALVCNAPLLDGPSVRCPISDGLVLSSRAGPAHPTEPSPGGKSLVVTTQRTALHPNRHPRGKGRISPARPAAPIRVYTCQRRSWRRWS